MVRLNMVPNRGVPVVAVHVSERHRRGSEPGYDEDSKNLLESVFHGNPGGRVRLVSVEKRDAKPEATAMRRHFNAVTSSESPDERWEHVQASPEPGRHAWLRQGCSLEPLPRSGHRRTVPDPLLLVVLALGGAWGSRLTALRPY